MFASLRSAAITVFVVLFAVGVAWAVHASGVRTPPPEVASFITAPATWITQTSTFLVYVLAVVFVADSVKKRLIRSLEELRERSAELTRTAEKLRDSEQRHRLLAENVTDVVYGVKRRLDSRNILESLMFLGGKES